ncbi:MAG: hypothetical protein OXT67_00870 [Zetaproteobacteria bacterium]|nr:hypothetical protein [Zetaproteobacteria bacterium]
MVSHAPIASNYPTWFVEILLQVAQEWQQFYASDTAFCIGEFLSSPQMSAVPVTSSCVLLHQPTPQDMELAVYFTEDVVERCKPLLHMQVWTAEVLPAYWVLVEEVSHFFLLCERGLSGQQTTRLELEWQGEVDKLLFSARRLYEQTGDYYFHALFHHLFEQKYLFAGEHYRTAHLLAARFWRSCLQSWENLGRARVDVESLLQRYFRRILRQPLSDKRPGF